MRCFYDVRMERYQLIATDEEIKCIGVGTIYKAFKHTKGGELWVALRKYHDRDTVKLMKSLGVKVEEHTSIRDILEEYLPEGLCDEAVKRIKGITTYRRGYAKA